MGLGKPEPFHFQPGSVTKKFIFLFLGLVLPILIFIFLKVFGRNQFDVPALYADGVPPQAGCNVTYTKPYVIPDTLWNRLRVPADVKLVVVSYAPDHASLVPVIDSQRDLWLVRADALEPDDSYATFIRECMFLVKYPVDVALIDRNRNIRGHYNVQDQDELDRLKTEIAIILGNY
jgi:hypothetical protein